VGVAKVNRIALPLGPTQRRVPAAPVVNSSAAPNRRAAMFNSFSGVITRAIAGLSRIVVLFLIARAYGPNLFGKVSLAFSVMEIFRSFSEFGLDTIALRKFSHVAEEQHSEILSHILTSKILAAVAFYAVSLGVVALISPERQVLQFAAVTSVSLLSANIVGALSSYYQSQLGMTRTMPWAFLAYTLYVLASCWAIGSGVSLVFVLAILPLCELLYFTLLLRQCLHLPRIAAKLSTTFALFRESLPLGIMSAMIFLYMRFDSIVVYKALGSTALAYYAICFRIVEPVLMVPIAFSTTLLSLLSGPAGRIGTGAEHRQVFHTTFETLWPAYAFVTLTAIILMLFGRQILSVFGSQYVEGAAILKILAMSLFVRTINVTLTTLINSSGRYRVLAQITASNLLVNIVLVLLLVNRIGLVGAAWAVLGTEAWNTVAQACALSRTQHAGQGGRWA